MYPRICLAVAVLCCGLQAQVAIVNNASFRPEQPVSAGSWVAAFPTPSGSTFAGITTTTTATGFPLPTTLGNVKVTIDGVDAPLYFVAASQMVFLIPYGMSNALHPVVITTPTGTVNGSVRVMAASPGLFIKDTSISPPRGAVRNQDGVTENTSSTPANRGDVISIYGTGPGALDHSTPDGAAPGANPLIKTVSTPQVYFGSVPAASVDFSGLNPDAPGLWQINARIPANLPITGAVPVIVFIDGVDSNEVTVFVQ
jgi:uncharacterized protein (TIGR03437 family)